MKRKIPIRDSSGPTPAGDANGDSGAAVEVNVEPTSESNIAELEGQLKEAKDQYLRSMADFQNFRRRSEEQKTEIAQFANRELILGLLPILDDFERAMAAAEESHSFEKLMGGVALTQRKLQ